MIRLEVKGAVAVVTLERPERRNALHLQGCEELAAAVGGAVREGARALVLRGVGANLCAGADLTTVEDPAFTPALQRALRALAAAPVVVMAAIEGACMGAGLQLALAADLRVATPDARLAVPAARLGLAIDGWTARRLAAAAGSGEAAALLLAAQELTGARAHAIGLVQRLGTAVDAVAWAHEIVALAPLTQRAHKLALATVIDADPEAAVAAEAARRVAWGSADLQEGRAAFAGRREPRFTGG